MNTNTILSPGSTIKKVLIWKDLSEVDGYMELECALTFDDGSSIQYIIGQKWDKNKYITCPLESDKYTRGIYEYKDGQYIQIEDWDN